MQKGWFDLFRENGGPTLYAHPNRTHGQYTSTVTVGFARRETICYLFSARRCVDHRALHRLRHPLRRLLRRLPGHQEGGECQDSRPILRILLHGAGNYAN